MTAASNDMMEEGTTILQTITSAPTTSKRRIQQSLMLANRLQGK